MLLDSSHTVQPVKRITVGFVQKNEVFHEEMSFLLVGFLIFSTETFLKICSALR